METLVLTVHDMRRLVRIVGLDELMDRLIDAQEVALARFASDVYLAPPRDGFSYEGPELGLIEWMPVMETPARLATIKVVGYHPENPQKRGLPTILSSIVQCDTETGHLAALLDGTFATALRTGAASAVASRLMAEPNSRVLGLIGCGAQGMTQFHALSRCFPLERVQLFDIDVGAAESFAERIAGLGIKNVQCEVVATANDAVRGADILCTNTSVEPAAGPVFEDRDLSSRLHINAVGSDFPGKIEVPLSVLERSFVCADFVEQCLLEGECQQLDRDQISISLPKIVQTQEAAVEARERISVYDSTGWSLQDHVAAQLLVGEALRLGLGSRIKIESSSLRDAKNPYAFLDDRDRPERLEPKSPGWSTRKRA